MTNPSGKAPPLNVPNWEVIYNEDFKVDCNRGEFLSKYGATTTARKEGMPTSSPWKIGRYSPEILEVKDSQCIMNVETKNGYPRVAALLPKLTPEAPYGVDHGRFSICFKSESLPGYKVAWLLWPDTGNWPHDGEIDFPECDLSPLKLINGFMHRQNATEGSDQWHVKSSVVATDGHWHICTINWKPGGWRTAEVEFILDGVKLGETVERVPNGPMHWVIQTEPLLRWLKPDVLVKGRIFIDWMVAYKYAARG